MQTKCSFGNKTHKKNCIKEFNNEKKKVRKKVRKCEKMRRKRKKEGKL